MQQDRVFLRMGLIDCTNKGQFWKTAELSVSGWHGSQSLHPLSTDKVLRYQRWPSLFSLRLSCYWANGRWD